jgi:hypothetical protein
MIRGDSMVRTQIQMTEKQAGRIRETAGQMGICVSELVRRAVDRALATQSQRELIRKRSLNVIGCVASGKGDLSANHDKYLDDAYAH